MRLMEGLRWVFNFKDWQPTREEWLLAARCIQPEEKQRISRFMFVKDAKAAMAGRLLLRKAIAEKLDIPYEKITLSRTREGKPHLVNIPQNISFSFNTSHQGSLAVLAAEFHHQLGVDVVNIEKPAAKSIEEYFKLMSRVFTTHEWKNIRRSNNENEQLVQFYRHWALKESYVKATGAGIGFGLKRLSFHILTPELNCGKLTSDTKLFVDGILASQWEFQETMLDETHITVVAVCKQILFDEEDDKDNSSDANSAKCFKLLNYDELISKAAPLQDEDEQYWENFQEKKLVKN